MPRPKNCPKCRSSRIGGPQYSQIRNCLIYECLRCGYQHEELPADTARSLGQEQEQR